MLIHIASKRPGRRPTTAALPPERRRPDRAAVSATSYKMDLSLKTTSHKPPPVFKPRHTERMELPKWLETEVSKHWRINVIQSPRTTCCSRTWAHARRGHGMEKRPLVPVPARSRTPWRACDASSGPGAGWSPSRRRARRALRESIVWAGQALRAHGYEAFVIAAGIPHVIIDGLRSHEGTVTLRATLANEIEHLDWIIAQASAGTTPPPNGGCPLQGMTAR